MAITLPKKIFGRDTEGGIERALAAKAGEQSNLEANTAEPLPTSQQINPVNIDWVKFAYTRATHGILDAIYLKHFPDMVGQAIFIEHLWKASKRGQNYIRGGEISDLLLKHKAVEPKDAKNAVIQITDKDQRYPGVAASYFGKVSKATYFVQIIDPLTNEPKYKIERTDNLCHT
jgi:hypothetical protein